jgi:Tfp pilus tip-associated adhesin PilY1
MTIRKRKWPSLPIGCAVTALWLGANVLASQGRQAGTVELSPLPLDRAQAVPSLAVLGLNGSVLSAELLAFEGGYDPLDWSGVLQAVTLKPDGTRDRQIWDAGAMLTHALLTPPDRRIILTASANATGTVTGMAFEASSSFDASEMAGLMPPESDNADNGTLADRVNYLRGQRADEQAGILRKRSSLLGAIIHAQAIYVTHPAGIYADSWPIKRNGVAVAAPEMAPSAQSYTQFVEDNAGRAPVLYQATNDGMLHAFNATPIDCDASSSTSSCRPPANGGKERWAYVPRAVYANLGNLTRAKDFQFQPTVDATPVVRDIFFSEQGQHEWHTLLAGGLRLGGRGVYALDITHPDTVSEVFPGRTVLWEFDADAPPGISSAGDSYNPADLGYTYGQPAIARLANGRWAVLMPSGYFPDCSQPDQPSHCERAAAHAPADSSALFVLDAQTGEVIRELKTSSAINGAAGYGLTTPVLGDYNNDQIDDVAFAGDLAGNLWRFDLSAPNPMDWKITLAYRPPVPFAQPITIMPRLFPDPATHRFIIVFGTGKYLGDGDRSTAIPVQSVYGIRDRVDRGGNPITLTRDNLQAQTLTQTVDADATLRNLAANAVPSTAGGWYVDLNVMAGERVVATPTALFNTGSVLITTLIPGNDPETMPQGAIMAIDAATGGPGNIVSFGGVSYAGGMVSQSRTTGTLPVAAAIGGGRLMLPGIGLKSRADNPDKPLQLASPLWRRRSWYALNPDY